jgi:hypothetical protein
LGKPGPQGGYRFRGQRRDLVFAAFAVAGDVCSGAEMDIAAGEAGEFGGAQPGLDGEQNPGVVAAAGAGGAVRGGEQRLGLGIGEERDDRLVSPFGRDSQDPVDISGVLGVAQCAKANREWIAASRALRVRTLLPRSCSSDRGTRRSLVRSGR